MNEVILSGRLTNDPDVRTTSTGKTVATYTLAVDRRAVKSEQKADFIRCQAWEKRAEFAQKYLHKGTKIIVTGRIQTGDYTDKDGKKVYTTDIVAEDIEFCEKKTDGDTSRDTASAPSPKTATPTQATMNDFVNIADDGIEEDRPFA